MARIVGGGVEINDELPGTAEADDIYGRTGDDTLDGLGGGDRIIGGGGNDILAGGPDDDTLLGGFDGFEALTVEPLPENPNTLRTQLWLSEVLTPDIRAGWLNSPWGEFFDRTLESLTSDWRSRDADLPASPSTAAEALRDGWTDETAESLLARYHPGADQDLRFYGDGAAPAAAFPNAGQQATYYSGRLITDGPGAGTPDLVSPESELLKTRHSEYDVGPFNGLHRAERLGHTNEPAWLLYHELGWAPKNTAGANEYWGFDGNDTLRGGPGSDTYVFGVGGESSGFYVTSGQDTIDDMGNADEVDTILVYGDEFAPGSGIGDYFEFISTETDLTIVFKTGTDYADSDNQGQANSITIKNMNDPAQQVENLALVRDGVILGHNLVDEWENEPPVVTVANQAVDLGDFSDVASWFTATDSDSGDAIEFWSVWDYNAAPTSGFFRGDGFRLDDSPIEGGAFPAEEQIRVSPEQLASLEFGGATERGTERLGVTAWDGEEWGEWAVFDVLVGMPDLAGTSWDVTAVDEQGNDLSGSELYFTAQEQGYGDGVLEGYFDWETVDGEHYGREVFTGDLNGSEITLHGEELVNATGLALAEFTGTLSEDGYEIVNGSWSGVDVIPGEWSAVIDVVV